jgi:hypothetical protein
MWYVLMGIGSIDCDEPPRDSRGGSSRDSRGAGAPVVGIALWTVVG